MVTTATTPFEAPVIDSLSIRVVVDSRYEAIMPGEAHRFASIEHIGEVPGRVMSTFAAEYGLSLHLVARVAGEQAEYMLDFGWTPEVINRNFDLLGIDPARLRGLILSHGHLDHFGGMDGFLSRYRHGMRDDLALYVGGEQVFEERWIKDPVGLDHRQEEISSWGRLDREQVLTHRVMPVCCDRPQVLDCAFTSGYIERNTFEKMTSPTLISAPDHFTEGERQGKLEHDNHPEEHALCYLVRDRGLVVITSCGHVGLINTVKAAMAIAGTDRLHAVAGGFHLAASPAPYVAHTVDALAELDPDVVLPMHCTGRTFIEMMRQRMPDKLIDANVGSRYTLGV